MQEDITSPVRGSGGGGGAVDDVKDEITEDDVEQLRMCQNLDRHRSSRVFFPQDKDNLERSLETSYDYLIKLLLLGNSCVGKTCFLHRYTDGQFREKFIATVGVDFRLKKLIYELPEEEKKVKVHVQLWDTAGQERYRSLTKAFFRDGMGFLLFFDLSNENSFRSIQEWISEIRENAYTKSPDILLIGNKSDLDHRAVSSHQAKQLAESLGIPYFETSAATGDNVEEAVSLILERIMKRMIEMQQEEEDSDTKPSTSSTSRSLDLNEAVSCEGGSDGFKKRPTCPC